MARGKPSQDFCRICDEMADGVHFDVDTCRACAAFFRRAVCRTGRPYTCRVEGRCSLRNGTATCKACRYARCQLMGMNPRAVQPSRDVIGKKPPTSASSASVSPSLSPSIASPSQETAILSRMETAYMKMEEDRKIIHRREDIMMTEGISLCLQEANNILVRDSPLVIRWLLESFPPLMQLQRKHLERFFGACYMPLFLVEAAYYSGKRGDPTRAFLQTGDYIDMTNPKEFYGNTDGPAIITSDEAVRLFAPGINSYNRRVFQPMCHFQMSFYELLALTAMVAWEPGNPILPESDDDLCRRTRLSVCSELMAVYQTEGRPEGAERLAALLTFLPAMKKAVDDVMDNVQMCRIFNVYATDDNFYALMNLQE